MPPIFIKKEIQMVNKRNYKDEAHKERDSNLFNWLLWWLMFDMEYNLEGKRYAEAKKDLDSTVYSKEQILATEQIVLECSRMQQFFKRKDKDMSIIRCKCGEVPPAKRR